MFKPIRLLLAGAALLGLLAACASQGPETPVPPTVRVSRFVSTVITPDVVKFEARIVVHNNMRKSLELEKVDYGSALFDKQLFTSTFADLKRMDGNGDETVTFPFQISMKDILNQAPNLLAEGKLKVTFDGVVYPSAASTFQPIAFTRTIELPIPRIPLVSFAGAVGLPTQDLFRVRLNVKNTNDFPISVDRVDTFLVLNQERYRLLHTERSTEIQPGETATVTLQMENSTGKTLSMILNAIQAQAVSFTLGGTITCGTPYGWVFIPLELQGQAQ